MRTERNGEYDECELELIIRLHIYKLRQKLLAGIKDEAMRARIMLHLMKSIKMIDIQV